MKVYNKQKTQNKTRKNFNSVDKNMFNINRDLKTRSENLIKLN